MRILHLFDWYLPSTLSWVGRLLAHLQQTEVAAPWIVKNQFYQPQFRYWKNPLQIPGLLEPVSEWELPGWQRLFARSQRFFPSYRWWLEKQLRYDPPDVLHAHFGPTGCLYLPLAQKLKRPLVVTFYGFDYEKLLNHRPVFRRKYRQLFVGASRVVAASPTGCQALEALGCPAEKLRVVRPSPDLAMFPFFLKKKNPGQLNLVQVATFTAKKGHLTTLEALKLALPGCPDLHLTLAGEQQDKLLVRRLKQFIREHNLEQNVRWLNPVQHTDMANFLSRFDAFIHPSCRAADGDHEATPVVLLEAQAVGLPVLATRHFDLADAVRDGYSGLLADEEDAARLAKAIQQFYSMGNQEFARFQVNARKQVETQFTVQMSAAALHAVYRELVI
ncbi:MAG: glycosyltransferase family 4 protein [Saprospiraceae bacterium]